MPYSAVGDSTGLLAHPSNAFIYVIGLIGLVHAWGI